jgi:hypothetical protein
MSEYTVVSGDNLTRIAARHHIHHWQAIYLAAENAAFRALRPNPDLIYPGDVIHIPRLDEVSSLDQRPVFVRRDVPLFTQSAETCWRATGKMLYLRQYRMATVAQFNSTIGERYSGLETGLASEFWADFYTRKLGMTETVITGPNDLLRLIATRGPVIVAIGDGDSAHSMVMAGYDILRGRYLVLDPAAGEEMTFAAEVIVTGSGTRPAPDAGTSGATLDDFRTGPATWQNMSRWLWIFDTTVHQRVFHY